MADELNEPTEFDKAMAKLKAIQEQRAKERAEAIAQFEAWEREKQARARVEAERQKPLIMPPGLMVLLPQGFYASLAESEESKKRPLGAEDRKRKTILPSDHEPTTIGDFFEERHISIRDDGPDTYGVDEALPGVEQQRPAA